MTKRHEDMTALNKARTAPQKSTPSLDAEMPRPRGPSLRSSKIPNNIFLRVSWERAQKCSHALPECKNCLVVLKTTEIVHLLLFSEHVKMLTHSLFLEQPWISIRCSWKIYRDVWIIHRELIDVCRLSVGNLQISMKYTWTVQRYLWINDG